MASIFVHQQPWCMAAFVSCQVAAIGIGSTNSGRIVYAISVFIQITAWLIAKRPTKQQQRRQSHLTKPGLLYDVVDVLWTK